MSYQTEFWKSSVATCSKCWWYTQEEKLSRDKFALVWSSQIRQNRHVFFYYLSIILFFLVSIIAFQAMRSLAYLRCVSHTTNFQLIINHFHLHKIYVGISIRKTNSNSEEIKIEWSYYTLLLGRKAYTQTYTQAKRIVLHWTQMTFAGKHFLLRYC